MPLSREDRWLTYLLLLSFGLTVLFCLINITAFHYTGISYFPRESTPLICLGMQFAYFDKIYDHVSPRTGFIIRNAAFYGLANIALALFVSGLQFTPFPPIDETLQHWDQLLHFDTGAVIAWTAAHPLLHRFLDLCYMSTDVQVALAPLAAGFAFDRRRMRVYLYAFVYAFLAGGLFYYFFPSSGPGSVYQTPNFAPVQLLTSAKFYWVHHRLPVTTMWGGMIAFPSFHVMWAVITTYAALPYRKLFWGIALLNVLVIASTLLLGWHYLVDVPAGMLLGVLSLYAGEFTHRRLAQ
jgi:membrane-associated phospholipid phosphatase